MRTDADKERIRLEELLRHEICTELTKASIDASSSSRVWKFLNSTFGLWLLSAIFISGAGGVFAYWQQKHTESMMERDSIEKLDLEISYRFSQVLLSLYELTDKTTPRANLSKTYSAKDVKKVLEILRESPSKSIISLYPEFSGLGIPSLLAELKRHTTDQELRREIDDRLAAITGKAIEDKDLTDVNEKAGTVLETLMLPRWRSGAFYFTDCNKTAPFC